tara:strand:+ start:3151 stop:3825 length:675 start_codon:yes stop_codon:yes gene_type:complete
MTVFDGNFNIVKKEDNDTSTIKEDLGFMPSPKEESQQFFNDISQYMQAGATPNIAIMWADQNQKNKSAFADFPDPVSANQSPTYNPMQAMVDASPMTQLIKALFGVDEFTGSFQQSRDEINDPHGDSSQLGKNTQNAIAQMSAMGIPPEIATSVIASTEPQPSPNPEGLYIRPNMLNQVPDSYSQAFKDANKAYMQNVAFRPSDFREEIDLRGFEKLQGLLDNA